LVDCRRPQFGHCAVAAAAAVPLSALGALRPICQPTCPQCASHLLGRDSFDGPESTDGCHGTARCDIGRPSPSRTGVNISVTDAASRSGLLLPTAVPAQSLNPDTRRVHHLTGRCAPGLRPREAPLIISSDEDRSRLKDWPKSGRRVRSDGLRSVLSGQSTFHRVGAALHRRPRVLEMASVGC
jgi:hypothetical protein